MQPRRWLTLGMGAAALTGLAWGLFSWVLGQAGHLPSGPAPLGAEQYERQAPLLPPLLMAAAWTGGAVSHRILAAKYPQLPRATTAGALALGLSLAFALLFLLPDALAYGLSGFDALPRMLPLTAPLTLMGALFVSARLLACGHGLPQRATAFPAAVGLVAAALVIGLVAR